MMFKCPKCSKLLKWDNNRKLTQVRVVKGITQPDKTYMVCRLCKHLDDAEFFKVIEKKKRGPKSKPKETDNGTSK